MTEKVAVNYANHFNDVNSYKDFGYGIHATAIRRIANREEWEVQVMIAGEMRIFHTRRECEAAIWLVRKVGRY